MLKNVYIINKCFMVEAKSHADAKSKFKAMGYEVYSVKQSKCGKLVKNTEV